MKELKELLSFVFALNDAVWKSLEDGQITFGDVVYLYETLKTAGPAIEGIDKIMAEFKNMTAEQREELMAFVREEFDLPNDTIEEIVEKAISIALDVIAFLKQIKKR